MLKKNFLLSTCFLLLSWLNASPAMAARAKSLQLGLDVLSHGYNSITKSPSGTKSILGTNYYQLHVQTHFDVSYSWQWSPYLGYMPSSLYARKTPDGGAKTSYIILGLPATYRLSDLVDVNIGPTLLWYNIEGSGGTAVLNNGNGTSTFGLPGRSVSAKTWAAQLGLAANSQDSRAAVDLLIEAPLNSSKRTISFLFTIAFDTWSF
ncbi:MAG: hypothetical protein ACOYOK_03645 [Pseudobdellovibrionaceae bacterium]